MGKQKQCKNGNANQQMQREKGGEGLCFASAHRYSGPVYFQTSSTFSVDRHFFWADVNLETHRPSAMETEYPSIAVSVGPPLTLVNPLFRTFSWPSVV